MYFVYIIWSQKLGQHYVGLTSDLSKRVASHNAGTTRSTFSGRPWVLVYQESFQTRLDARNREKYLKSYSGAGEKKDIIKASAKS